MYSQGLFSRAARKARAAPMRAVLVDDSGFDLVTDFPLPVPSDGEVLVKVLACGTCGSDLHVFEKDPNYAWVSSGFPLVMGHEIVGRRAGGDGTPRGGGLVVVRPRVDDGEDGSPVRIGWDRQGGFAEYLAVPEECVLDIADGISVTSAALAEPLAVAVAALRRSGTADRFGPQFRTQVVGMGAVGALAACVLAAEGCAGVEIVGTERDRSLGSFEMLEGFGLVPVLPGDASDTRDLVVNAAGSAAAVRDGVGRLGRYGVFLNIALGVGDVSLNFDALTRRDITLVNSYGSESVDWLKTLSYINERSFDPAGIVSHTVPLEDLSSGFSMLQAGRARKVLVDIDMEG